ncbi:MAG TPA: FBP domain-containing protein [Mycobacteriales bacterium]|nr:FBP domain-containing protein [Mycobacteriales bacterium]
MDGLSEKQVREAFRNCSRRERQTATLPELSSVAWENLEYLGWRDPKAPQRGYIVYWAAEGPRGIVLRAPESRVRRTAQCTLCQAVHQNGVALFVAPSGGDAGRSGNTIGTYICDDLACSTHLRVALRPSRRLPDPAPVIAERGAAIVRRLDAFVGSVLRD